VSTLSNISKDKVSLAWEFPALGEVVNPSRPRVKPAEKPALSFIGMDNIEAHTMKLLGTVPAVNMKSSAVHFMPGDVLYGRLRPYLNKVYCPNFEGLCSAEFIVFPNTENIYNHYLKYFLNSSAFVRFATSLNTGDRPRVKFEQLAPHKFPLPPFEQQKRIVEEIEKQFSRLDEAIENLKHVKANLKRYKASVLKASVEGKLTEEWRAKHFDVESVETLLKKVEAEKEKDFQKKLVEWEKISKEAKDKGKKVPVKPRKQKKLPPFSDDEYMELNKLPIGWQWVKNETYSLEVKDGTHDTPKYVEKGIPFVTQKNIKANRFVLDNIKYISKNDHESFYKRSNVEKDDILISMIGHNRGMNCIVNTDLLFSIKNVGLVKLINEIQSNKYLLYYYQSQLGQNIILKKSKGGAQQFIGLTELRNWPVPVCSFEEQKEIVRCVESYISIVEKADKQIDYNLQRADRLRQSILKKAFSGLLVQNHQSKDSKIG
jgi:type I restriction enzyme, S subunit